MTTLVLGAADAALGSAVSAATGLAASALSDLVFGSGTAASARSVEGPRLTEMAGLSSTEGAPVPRLYGRARLGGQLIWATRFEEVVTVTTERAASSGGKSLGGSTAKARTTTTTSYAYHANIAVGLCEGPVALVRRVWADGEEMDMAGVTWRLHRGTEDQAPDPLIVAKEGADHAPAYRGLAYLVFERLPLAPFGNRVPQLSFEVVRPVPGLAEMVRAVCLIPGATEFGYELAPVVQDLGLGTTRPDNTHHLGGGTDVAASLDALGALCPNVRSVSLVVSWFGDDLRAGACTITPRVDDATKTTIGAEWMVAGLSRASARVVSRVGEGAAYGGTPSDGSVRRLIAELKARGLRVTLYPFVMMDVPAGNTLPDPRTGAPGQPPYPWRGRITSGADGHAGAAADVASFFDGPEGFRRHILHYAGLAAEAGGVDAFVIGSEMIGLTRLRDGQGGYPAVAALRALAADVRSVVGPGTRLTYSADWTEYGSHSLDGGRELRFPLDPLWADPAIDAVGIDWYPPLSDWRDGPVNPDAAEARSAQDLDYLRAGLESGEGFDWFYASEADRRAGRRTPITDGAYGKPWCFRAKDLPGWWANAHVERRNGVETGATAWVPCSKPIWLNEIGIPAVDKGANGPNVFPDPKSAEGALPPFSDGGRDDLVQARGLEAILSRFDPALPGFAAGSNPVSPLYGGRMVDPSRTAIWAWDARPFPAFPDFSTVWADGPNWRKGHWITGRIEGVPLDRLVPAILADHGVKPGPRPPLDGFVDGYVLDRPMSARDALEPLADLFGFDLSLPDAAPVFVPRGGGGVATALEPGDLVEAEGLVLALTRAQETDLPGAVRIAFTDGEGEYARASAGAARLSGTSRGEDASAYAVVTTRENAERLAAIRLQDLWAARELAEFAVSPRAVALQPGDVVSWPGAGLYRITRIETGAARRVSARAVEPAIFTGSRAPASGRTRPVPALAGPPEAVILDLPVARGEPAVLQYLAVAASPWPDSVAIYRAGDGAEPVLYALADAPAIIGRTDVAFPGGPLWRWDDAARLTITVSAATLDAVSDAAALAGGNLFAVEGPDGAWEIVSAASVTLVGSRRYRLGRFLRGLAGSEMAAGRVVPAGARIVRLDDTLVPLARGPDALGQRWSYRIGPAARDPSDPSFVSLDATVTGAALRPLPPVHLRARRGPDGVAITWIRQTRIGGDGWDAADVPLGEERERYTLTIGDGALVKRSVIVDEPAFLYRAGDELADFGAAQPSLTITVAQHSAVVGAGTPRRATLPTT